ncbi:phosphoserine phosphatase SerB [Nesterenkonia halotolerans]|uniref:phosphoserine phosphatase n=1 Tax=Nesterenkonia halotolerans TaxID=225325 RepID=A0ABR9J4P2_9MICC|nr:phosphoserine phosphatase SerB [Nesterenkonia halotolerans]MBE1513839.1 phosphoserine phosphatase [Nesterenkonia halotolerans]
MTALPHPDVPQGTVALLAAPSLDGPLIRSLTHEFSRRGVVHSVELRDVPVAGGGEIQAARWSVTLDDADDSYGAQLAVSLLEDAADQLQGPVTQTVLPGAQRETLHSEDGRLMLLMDVDSTLIDQEVIELLARGAGREAEVAEVTERAMRGEIDFEASLHQRVAALSGLSEDVITSTLASITPTQGAEALLAELTRRGWPSYAVSGGFLQVLAPLAQQLGLTGFHANDLAISANGTLEGTVRGAVVDRAAKKEYLEQWSASQGLRPGNVVAVGDGANDLDMITAAGVGIAFCAKPALEEQADLVIRHRSFELISLALGLG